MSKGRHKSTWTKKTKQAPVTSRPSCPKELTGLARECFLRLVDQLEELGVLAKIDSHLITIYADSWETYLTAIEHMKKNGMTQRSESGRESLSPWVQIKKDADKSMQMIASSFGLTPQSRKKLETQKLQPPKADAFDDFDKESSEK